MSQIPDKFVNFEPVCLREQKTRGSLSGFLDALSVYINKPHVVNRRLVGSVTLYDETISDLDTLPVITENLKDKFTSRRDVTQLQTTINLSQSNRNCIFIRDLIPKQIDKYPTLRELISYDFEKKRITFEPICRINVVNKQEELDKNIDEEMIYSFTFDADRILLEVYKSAGNVKDGHVTLSWLTDVLLVKLSRWAEEESLRLGQTSLRLVAVDEYNKLYNELKQKYGVKLVEVWPERTDPQKFVYEDIAIATYLLLLWKSDTAGEDKKQSFVDLGCGNGLLVYILTMEGHKGLGLDLRKRQIWDWYGSNIDLKVESITPSSETLFPEYDWLIGNHSDELTPWIPVMAARSSYHCSYFVLPCCHYDFNCKFNQRDQGLSQYQTYLNFVKEVGDTCGFTVEEDTLRIPSTKRVCFIGRSRNYDESEETMVDEKRMNYINQRCSQGEGLSLKPVNGEANGRKEDTKDFVIQTDHSSINNKKIRLDNSESNPWVQSFQPRSAKEIPRNCQSVPKDVKKMIVTRVFEKLLSSEEKVYVKTDHGTTWNKGGVLPLSDVAELFTSDILQQLKCECGGLQTLLRNHNHIFQVTGGEVKLRDLTSDDPFGKKTSKKKKTNKVNPEEYIKTTLCWFHDHHPDGCALIAEKCQYAHGLSELKPKPAIS